jgi:hypothetical protein
MELAQVQEFVSRERSKSLSNKNSANVSLEYPAKEKVIALTQYSRPQFKKISCPTKAFKKEKYRLTILKKI